MHGLASGIRVGASPMTQPPPFYLAMLLRAILLFRLEELVNVCFPLVPVR